VKRIVAVWHMSATLYQTLAEAPRFHPELVAPEIPSEIVGSIGPLRESKGFVVLNDRDGDSPSTRIAVSDRGA
jgi:hypothetical protein